MIYDKSFRMMVAGIGIAGLSACGGGGSGESAPAAAPPPASAQYEVKIERTSFGIPHITASNLQSLAYGVGYSYAQDNVCLMADQLLTVRGDRAFFLGGATPVRAGSTTTNLQSDFVNRFLMDDAELAVLYAGVSADAKALMRGYAAGYNRYLSDTPAASLPAACRSRAWVRPMTESDMYRLMQEKAVQSGYAQFAAGMLAAQPPAPTATASVTASMSTPSKRAQFAQIRAAKAHFAALEKAKPDLGSNGYAFGKAATENGSGVLMGNPHFPWSTTNRFYQMHLTVPNRFNVMGASLGGFPLVNIGFTNDVAWTHTVSTGRRFTLFELTLKNNGTVAVIDGQDVPLAKRTISVPSLQADGSIVSVSREMWSSSFGPMISQTGLSWSASRAWAVRDANAANSRMIDQWLALYTAKTVEDMRAALLAHNGIPWVNTIASDRAGKAMYADISVTPNVSNAKMAQCITTPTGMALRAGRTFILDGSRSACDWDLDAASGRRILPPAGMPAIFRDDYAGNSNESAWMAHPAQLQADMQAIVGDGPKEQSVRTRMAFTEIANRLSGSDGLAGNKVSLASLETVFFQGRSYASEATANALVALCRETPTATTTAGLTIDLKPACDTLAAWNKRMDFNAVGVPVFREWWRATRSTAQLWAVPFSAADPVNTPRTLNVANATVKAAALRNLADAVDRLQKANAPLSARLRDLQFSMAADGSRIAIDGGDEFEGTFNKMTPAAGLSAAGYTPIVSGSSYIQVVSFDASGPVARGILTYSQSTDPASPQFDDQTKRYSTGAWVNLPFKAADIAADPNLKTLNLRE